MLWDMLPLRRQEDTSSLKIISGSLGSWNLKFGYFMKFIESSEKEKVMLQLNNANEGSDNGWGKLLLDGYHGTSLLTTSPAVSA